MTTTTVLNEFVIHSADKITESNMKREILSLNTLSERLRTPHRGDKGSAGYFVAGDFETPYRAKENVKNRGVLVFDLDNIPQGVDLESVCSKADHRVIGYTSHKHTPEAPRWRILIPLQKPIEPDHYKPVMQSVAVLIGFNPEWIDNGSYGIERAMYYPTKQDDHFQFFDNGISETLDHTEVFDPEAVSVTAPAEYTDTKTDINDAHNVSRIETECGFMTNYLDNIDNASYDEWLAVMSIASRTENHRQTAHRWSQGHPTYSEQETDKKVAEARKNMTPRTCGAIHGQFHDGCKTCPHFGKIGSPIALGMQNEIETGSGATTLIPNGYDYNTNSNELSIVKSDKEGNEYLERLIRHTPFITKVLQSYESNDYYYQVEWSDGTENKKEIVPARSLQIRSHLEALSDKGLPVNSNNANRVIQYFDDYLAINRDLPKGYNVDRLGWIRDRFIHPLTTDLEITHNDVGETQMIEAFETAGTAEEWRSEVFNRIRHNPIPLVFTIASFASVLIKKTGADPFVIEISAPTSTGKTTANKVASSVWGTDKLINTFNTTPVALERTTSFLNSFPMIMDDTREATDYIVKSFVYNFASGTGKNRGTATGTQMIKKWKNILLTTGENNLLEHPLLKDKAGTAGRVIPLNDRPFPENIKKINDIKTAVSLHYGSAGLEFTDHIRQKADSEIREDYRTMMKHYHSLSGSNAVLGRISEGYAVIALSAKYLKELGYEFDMNTVEQVFKNMAETNKETDKPMKALEELLQHLESNSRNIHYSHKREYPPHTTEGLFKKDTHETGDLYLTVNFVQRMLEGETKEIRKQWVKRGLIEHSGFKKNGEPIDTTQVKISGKNYKALKVNRSVVQEIGHDFYVHGDEDGYN